MLKKVLLFILIVSGFRVFSQSIKVGEHFGLGIGFAKKQSATSLNYYQTLSWGKNAALRAGTGVRMTAFSTKQKEYLGIGTKLSNTTLTPLPKGNMFAFNIPVIFELHGKKGFVGVNLDIIGMSFGKKRDSLNITWKQRPDSLFIKPTAFNTFLGSGTTNTELYIGFKPQQELSIRAGVSFVISRFSSRYSREGEVYDFGKFKYSTFIPFISVVFNFEK